MLLLGVELLLARLWLMVGWRSAVQKRLLLDRAGVSHTWILTYALMLGPAVLIACFNPSPLTGGFWRDILIGGGLDAIGNLAMIAALRSTDLSIFGPLNALRPILALLFGWVFLGEHPTSVGMIGIGITVFGGVILFTGREASNTTRSSMQARSGLGSQIQSMQFMELTRVPNPATLALPALALATARRRR